METVEERRSSARILGLSLEDYDAVRAEEAELIESSDARNEAHEAAREVSNWFIDYPGGRRAELYRWVASQLKRILQLLEDS